MLQTAWVLPWYRRIVTVCVEAKRLDAGVQQFRIPFYVYTPKKNPFFLFISFPRVYFAFSPLDLCTFHFTSVSSSLRYFSLSRRIMATRLAVIPHAYVPAHPCTAVTRAASPPRDAAAPLAGRQPPPTGDEPPSMLAGRQRRVSTPATQIQAPANSRELIPFPVLDLIFFFSSWPLVAWFEWKPCVSLSTKFLLKCCFRLWLISWWSVHIYSVPSWAYHKPQASFKFPLNVLVFNRKDIKYFSTLTSAFLASWDEKKTLLCQLLKQDISCYQNVPFVLSNKFSSVALVYPYLHGETSLKKNGMLSILWLMEAILWHLTLESYISWYYNPYVP